MPPRDSYRAALLRARIRQGQIDERSARLIIAALEQYGRRIEAGLGDLPRGRAEAESLAASIILDAAGHLDRALAAITGDARELAFDVILELWERAGREAAAASNIPANVLGAVRTPPLSMLGAFENISPAGTWRTLIRTHVRNAAQEAHRIVRLAIAEGADPTELARRLRRYVTGSESFGPLFESVPTATGDVLKLDMRKLPRTLRGAARQMEYNARRIAFTEAHNARAEAEIQHFATDPMVKAVRWTLAPDRGSAKVPDVCDVLAGADYYGLGPGVYPITKVPPKGHPFCRCETMPVIRGMSKMTDPKPDPARVLAYEDANIPNGMRLTPDQAKRVREAAARAVAFGERAAHEIERRRIA